MKRIVFITLFCLVLLVRWVTLPSPLPVGSNSESVVRYGVTLLEDPEYTDSQTIVRSGIWYIKIKGYHIIIPGSMVRFEGRVEPKWSLGKPVQIMMIDPNVEDMGEGRPGYAGKMLIVLGNLRERWMRTLQRTMPEPMASLSAGILLGVKGQMPQDFHESLVNTGTLHIVAASGYNVTIVATVLMRILSGFVVREIAVGVGVIGILVYVLISGGSASVVRAGIMGSLTLIAYYFGRPAEAKRLLWVTAGIMLLVSPLMIVDIGFQLSVVATAGLLYIEPWLKQLGDKWIMSYAKFAQAFVADYLYPTLAATAVTLPVILWHFGRISWISPLVNILVLPVVPLVMFLTALTLACGQIMAWITYVPLAYMVYVIKLFGN